MQYLNGLPDEVVVLGDQAYRGLHDKVIVPHRGPQLTNEQAEFNQEHAVCRQIVERVIGALQVKWRILQLEENRLPAKTSIEFACKSVVAAAQLHNRFTNLFELNRIPCCHFTTRRKSLQT